MGMDRVVSNMNAPRYVDEVVEPHIFQFFGNWVIHFSGKIMLVSILQDIFYTNTFYRG